MKRSEKQISSTLAAVKQVWLKNPNLRLMQLIGNTHATAYDPYYWEDSDLLANLEQTYDQKETKSGE